MRVVLILCVLARVAAADRQQLAETRDCQEAPVGVVTQLVGDRLFVLRDDGMSWNALWVIELAPRPTVVERIDLGQIKPRAFRLIGDRLYIMGALPPTPPPGDQAQLGWTVHPERVIVLDARRFTFVPHENAAGFPACQEPADDVAAMKAVRAGETTVVAVHASELWPGEQHLVVLRGDQSLGELDHHELEIENYRAFCATLHISWLAHEHACSDAAFAEQARSSAFSFLAIRWGTLVSASAAGIAVHDLATRELVGGVPLSELQAMLPTISLR